MPVHNNLNLIGYLGNDARIHNHRDTGVVTGLSFSLAVDKRIPDPERPGEWKDGTNWFRINVSESNRSFEYLAKNLLKGARVAVAGYLVQRERQIEIRRGGGDNVEIQKEYFVDINGTDIQFLSYAKAKETENAQQAAPVPSPSNEIPDVPGDDIPLPEEEQTY